jgi:hypothetical protein
MCWVRTSSGRANACCITLEWRLPGKSCNRSGSTSDLCRHPSGFRAEWVSAIGRPIRQQAANTRPLSARIGCRIPVVPAVPSVSSCQPPFASENIRAQRRMLVMWQLFLTLGAILMSDSVLAQDACALQCSSRESAWCTGQEFICPFNFQSCMAQCEGQPGSAPGPHYDPCYLAQNALRPVGLQSGQWRASVSQLAVVGR